MSSKTHVVPTEQQELNVIDGLRLGQYVYLRHRANPFIPTGGSPDWNVNYLAMKDDAMRKKSGVGQIDQSLTDAYATNPEKSYY